MGFQPDQFGWGRRGPPHRVQCSGKDGVRSYLPPLCGAPGLRREKVTGHFDGRCHVAVQECGSKGSCANEHEQYARVQFALVALQHIGVEYRLGRAGRVIADFDRLVLGMIEHVLHVLHAGFELRTGVVLLAGSDGICFILMHLLFEFFFVELFWLGGEK